MKLQPKAKQELKTFWTPGRVALEIGRNKTTLYRWCDKNVNLLPDFVEKDGTRRYRPSKVLAWAKRNPK